MRFSALLLFVSIAQMACGARTIATPESAASQRETLGPPGGADPEGAYDTDELAQDQEPSHDADLEEMEGRLPATVEQPPHPLEDLSNEEVEAMLIRDPGELGPASLGRTNAGALFGAVQMPEGENWKLVNPRESYGTQETIDYLIHTINRVNEIFPDSPKINVGDISRPDGGHFTPHVSHQSGRDLDIGFYYLDASKWYAKADASNLDLARTWAFVKLTITETDVQVIFVDRSIITLLHDYATELGEDPQWLEEIFGGPGTDLRPMLLHEPGHQTHLHVRYYNPIAQETGRRVYQGLIKHKKIKPPTYYLKYKVKRGDSLNRIAKKHNTSVDALKKANRLRSNRIYAGRTYKIPKRGGVVQPPKLELPARRLPTGASSPGASVTMQSAAIE